MAKVTGKNATILIGGYSLSPYASGYEINPGLEPVDITGFQDPNQNFIPGIWNGEMNINMFWNSTAGSANAALSALGTKAVTVIPETYVLGGDALSMYATQTSWNPSGDAAGSPLKCDSVNFKGLGASGYGVMGGVMLAHQTITNTLTGTGVRDATEAAITAPCVGILHIWTACAADTYVVKIQDSTDNNTWADLITFTANGSAITSEIVAVASDTVNQYRRVVATRTGAAANPFGLSVFFWRKNA